MDNFISGLLTTRAFSNRVINNIIPAPTARARLLLNEPPEAVSSAGSSAWLSSLRRFLSYLQPTTRQEAPETGLIRPSPQRPPAKTSYSIPNCYQFYTAEVPSIECYGHGSRVSIHPAVTEDTFGSCHPLTYDGVPSVFCAGEHSALLFASFEGPKLFDFVDGWLLLARVMPTAVRSVARGFRHVFSAGRIAEPVASGGSKIALLRQMRKLSAGLGSKRATELSWAGRACDELEEDVMRFVFGEESGSELLALLEERTDALREDIREEMELRAGYKLREGNSVCSLSVGSRIGGTGCESRSVWTSSRIGEDCSLLKNTISRIRGGICTSAINNIQKM